MKYTKELKEPIARKRFGLLAGEKEYRESDEAIAREMLAKLPALAEAHSVQPGNWFALALALAQTYVPGFKVIDRLGRPTEWSDADKAELRIDVDAIRKPTGKTLDASIKAAMKEPRWADRTGTPAALRQHYYDADSRWVAIVQDARAYKSMAKDD